jgi:threonine dehydratase
LNDVYKARRVVSKYLPRTPLVTSPALSKQLGFEAYVKCENTLPTGSFKVRGGINLVLRLTEEENRRGIITTSTGNHASQ